MSTENEHLFRFLSDHLTANQPTATCPVDHVKEQEEEASVNPLAVVAAASGVDAADPDHGSGGMDRVPIDFCAGSERSWRYVIHNGLDLDIT